MKKIKYLLLVLMIIIPLNTKALTFIKVDEEGNYINDAEFTIHSLDGSITYPVYKTVEKLPGKSPTPMSVKKLATGDILNNGQYFFNFNGQEQYSKVYNVLGVEEKKILDDLKDLSKYEEYENKFYNGQYGSEFARLQVTRGIWFGDIYNSCSPTNAATPTPQSTNIKNYSVHFLTDDETSDSDGGPNVCTTFRVSVPVLMILEETKAPAGLKKEKAVVGYTYNMTYSFDSSDNFIGAEVNYYARNIYKYNYDIDYSNVIGISRKELTLVNMDELYYKNDCGEFYDNHGVKVNQVPGSLRKSIMQQSAFNYTNNYNVKKVVDGNQEVILERMCKSYPVIIDYKDGAKLTITSYVNNGGRAIAVKGSELSYKVVVKNEGTNESTNNVITSKIPEGFAYVSGSASDNGEYIESLNAVRWNVGVIEEETSKELTYKVSVSEDVDLDKAYTNTATVINDSSSDEIESNETKVILEGEIVNPKTGDFNKVIILFVLCVVGLIGYYIIDNKKIMGL